MKQNIKKIIFANLLASVIISCTRKEIIADIVFPDVENKIAIFCQITPADSIWVRLTKLKRVNEQLYETAYTKTNLLPDSLNNAIIELINENSKTKIQIKYAGIFGTYRIAQKAFPIKRGEKYSLSVRLPNYPVMSSSCKVPSNASLIDSFTEGDLFQDGSVQRRRIEARWFDVSTANEKLTYLISTGNGINGASFTDITQINNTLFFPTTIVSNGSASYVFNLYTVESNFYQFRQMAERISVITNKGTGDFLGAYQGIIPVFTNIENGYGVFGAYLTTSKTVIFK